ncbi:unnamed protein product [Clonostachys rosea]|uniref:Major facilitator superfamily (MFS) profile domain-containing protein n=1 Tax=Bionectria ochroleuca TaxID=29856 RepID=A0ABY6UXA8_BIOOC|nr:unnamed protein product [Clonostachys rosea]
MSSIDQATEASPLIPVGDADRQEPVCSHANDSEWTREGIQTASLAAIFTLLFSVADVFRYFSTLQLLELGVCQEQYTATNPDILKASQNIPGDFCASSAVQQYVADLRGYLVALEALVGLFLTLPYGLLVNRFGERLVAGLSLIGISLACAWILLVSFSKSAIPTWAVVLAPLFQVIGGGSPVLYSVVYSIAAKHIPDSHRSLCYSFFSGAQAVTEIGAVNLAALFMEKKLEHMPLVLTFPISLVCFLTLFFMRPKKVAKTARECESGNAEEERKLGVGSLLKGVHTVVEICQDPNVLILLAIFPITRLIETIFAVMLQYIPRRFGLSFATSSRLSSIPSLEALLVLVAIIPLMKHIAENKFNIAFRKVDLYIVRYGFLVMSFSCVMMAWSSTLVAFMLGISAFSFGSGTRPVLRSILTDMVDRDKIAVLYILMAVGDALVSATGALVIHHSFAIAIGWGNMLWLGLPFFIGAACYFYAFIGAGLVKHTALSRKPTIDSNSN